MLESATQIGFRKTSSYECKVHNALMYADGSCTHNRLRASVLNFIVQKIYHVVPQDGTNRTLEILHLWVCDRIVGGAEKIQ